MQVNWTKKTIIILLVVTIIFTVLISYAAALIWQQVTNGNHGELPPSASLFIYTVDGQPYKHGDAIEWGMLQYGENTATVRVVNVYEDPIKVSFLNDTMPTGWKISVTNNETVVPYLNDVLFIVTVTIPTTEQGSEFNWETSIYAEVEESA